MRRFLAGVGAVLAFAVILIGVPVGLIIVAGNPLPTAAEWHNIITFTPDYGNVILLTKVLPLIGWIAWAAFAIPFVVEIFAAIGGRTTQKRSWAFRGQQRLAVTLIAAIAFMFAGGLSIAGAVPAHAAEPAVASAHVVSAPVTQDAAAQTRTVTETRDVTVAVQEGDTLWGISAEALGNGADYEQIYNASTGTVQPDGQHLTDPDLILPGWNLTVPETVTVQEPVTPAPTAPAPTSGATSGTVHSDGATGGAAAGAAQSHDQATPSASSSAQAQPSGPGQVRTSSPEATQAAQRAATPKEEATSEDLSIPLTTGGGIAAVLAAGLLSALGIRRLQQRRRRRPGERIPMPTGADANEEFELRMVENPLEVEDVDNALRCLQAWADLTKSRLPEIFALRLESSEIALYLNEPADLPEPFEAASEDRMAWIVRPGRAEPPEHPTGSPYPALTSIGTDAHNGILMLDLEQIGALTVSGDKGLAIGVLNALACELAVNPWSDQIRVTLVGMPDLAADIAPYRVQHVDDVEVLIRDIKADLAHRQSSFASYGVSDVYEARTQASESESWAPHVVILGDVPSESIRRELAELVSQVPRLGIATVAQGAEVGVGSVVKIHSRDNAELLSAVEGIPPLSFVPQIVAGHEEEALRRVYQKADEPSFPMETTPVVDELVQPVDTAASAESVEVISEPVVDAAPLPAPAPEPALDPIAEAAPHLLLLGPVRAENMPEGGKMPGRGVELLAYLSLFGPVPGSELQEKFWFGKSREQAINNQKSLVGPTRTFLGNAPDGEKWLPENNAGVGFTLHPAISSDWTRFQKLIGPDLTATSDENLIAGVRLVRGVPFEGVSTTRGWWKWIAKIQQDMISEILDAAEELGRRALLADDTEKAVYAGRVAQTVEPLVGQGWRTEMRAIWKRHDIDEFTAVLERYIATLEAADPDDDIDEETRELVAVATADMSD